MSFAIGQHHRLAVVRESDVGMYLGTEDEQILLPWRYVPEGTVVGDELNVFVYTDSEDRPIATTLEPKAVVGEFAVLEVIDVNEAGAFLDWGLAKDLIAPFNEQIRPLRVGERLVFAISTDERPSDAERGERENFSVDDRRSKLPKSPRVRAASRLRDYFDYDVSAVELGAEVTLLVYGHNILGTLVVVDGRHSGLIYDNETFQPLMVGQELKGFVKVIRDDGKLDIRLQRVGRDASDDAQRTVLEALEAGNGTLMLHDKSSPDLIQDRLGMSKKAFKRALGGLYKKGVVELGKDRVTLKGDEQPQPEQVPAPAKAE